MLHIYITQKTVCYTKDHYFQNFELIKFIKKRMNTTQTTPFVEENMLNNETEETQGDLDISLLKKTT